MSDETTNASDNLNGSDPSMEDILASIRKIISDDEPVALESPEDISADGGPLDSVLDAAATAGSAAAGATVAAADFSAAEGESVDLNIDDVLAGLEEDIPAPAQELQSAASAIDIADGDMVDDDAFSNVLDDILTDEVKTYSLDETDGLPDAEDDILSLLDDEIPLEVESSAGVMPELVPDVPTEAPIEVAGLEDLASEVESLTDVESLLDDESLAEVESLGDDEPDDIEALLNGLLGDDDPLPIEDPIETLIEDDPIEAPVEEDPIEALAEDDPIETLLEDSIEDVDLDADELSAADLADSNAAPSGVEETEELELVKSLMADLSDDPAAVDAIDTIDTDEDLESLLSIPDADEVSADTSDAEAESDGDILGDIVDMAIEDEMQTHPEDLAALEDLVAEEEVLSEIAETEDLPLLDDVIEAEQENIAENAQLAAETAVEKSPSLSDIAAAAEADAVAVETAAMPAAAVAGAGALAGLTAVVAARAPEETPEEETSVEISDETPEINPSVSQAEPVELKKKLTLEPFPNQEIEMPVKAVQTDAILDDVTEAATAGAFAELNQVVEDKAVFNERGPRIGDLVQDALRPMLKEWLDANLKGIVERAVTKEVKRISSGK